MEYSFQYDILLENWREIASGIWMTVKLSASAMVAALVIGLGGVAIRMWGPKPLKFLVRTYVELIRNTPFLIQIFFIFFALPALGLRLRAVEAAFLALSLNGGAYAIEIIRGGLQAVTKGQIEAGFALGLGRLQVFRYVIVRPALRACYPALCGQFILLMLTSSIASSISAQELTAIAARIESMYFISFEVYVTITIIYLVLSILFGLLLKYIGRIYFQYPIG